MVAPQDILKELGDPTRLRVLGAILAGRKNVTQIVAELGLAQPQVSYHLRHLKDAGLAVEEKRGRWVYYEANRDSGDARVRELIDLLARWLPDAPPGEDRPEAAAVAPPERKDDIEDFLL